MTVKKNAVNISIVMILLSILIAALCQRCNNSAGALLYTLSTGVFGSSFATLWIFIYEYNRSKHEVLKEIFDEAVSVTENNTVCSLSRFGYYESGIKESMTGKNYAPPVPVGMVNAMDKETRCHYELCRFVDEVLNIDPQKISHVRELIESVDFWSDLFRCGTKHRNVIIRKLSVPLYDTFMSAPGEEDGYIFRYFSDFKYNLAYTADVIYPIAAELDKVLHIPHESSCPNHNPMTVYGYMHEQLWIFRDAFYSPHVCRKQRRAAKRAFIKNTPYPYIR